jgi:hypothetical protein
LYNNLLLFIGYFIEQDPMIGPDDAVRRLFGAAGASMGIEEAEAAEMKLQLEIAKTEEEKQKAAQERERTEQLRLQLAMQQTQQQGRCNKV